jgi:hypothetical protein
MIGCYHGNKERGVPPGNKITDAGVGEIHSGSTRMLLPGQTSRGSQSNTASVISLHISIFLFEHLFKQVR